jgi:hypothetical protein
MKRKRPIRHIDEPKCDRFAELELRHIQLELSERRTYHLRTFVDAYICYRERSVRSGSGAAHWEALMWRTITSKNAMAVHGQRDLVVKEHAVPLKVLGHKLLELEVIDRVVPLDAIRRVVDRYGMFATITKDEDADLRRMGLGSAMPNEFYDASSELFESPLARYTKAGFELAAPMAADA